MSKLSLQEQMLKAGLVSNKQANKAKKGSKKSRTLAKEVKASVEAKKIAEQTRAKELNKQQQEQKLEREIQAQIKQLIVANKIELGKGDIKYNFTDGTIIKSIYVDEATRAQLVKGLLAVARFEGGYIVVPNVVGKKISERDTSVMIENKTSEEIPIEDDPYADYVVPDDLMW
ncbi:DUF2058 domain-containing protein [Glaciecola sp. 1036]|uniref:DUF2058 domain-containing protein n=1 Tax=Alteromonadaceae TaxID=72275 RepID=UPI003CFFAAF7